MSLAQLSGDDGNETAPRSKVGGAFLFIYLFLELNLPFDVLADEPLHQRRGLTSGDAHHGLARSGSVVDVQQVYDDCRH